MNQQPIMQNPRSAVSKWLWILLIIVIVLAAGFFSWYYLMGPGKKAESTTTTPTTTKTTTTADWKVVKNTKYGYQVTLTDAWKGYKWEEVPGTTGLTETISYYTPTTDATVKENTTLGGKYAKIFNIIVFTPEQWTTADQTKNKYINKNDKYIFAYTTETVAATDLTKVDFKVTDVIASFKFTTSTTTTTTSTDLTYTNPTYGFTMTFPAAWKGYKFKETELSGATMTYYIEVPSTDSSATGDSTSDKGYYSPFAISVYTLDQWATAEAGEGPKDTLITKGTKYAFGWGQANGVPPSDFTTAMSNEVKTIIASFKLK